MSLDALAPDQRAVVQLVLQQDRSYGDLAGLLGITEQAVRERAHLGLERIAAGDAVDPQDRGAVADYLLGQQSVSSREATRSLLAGSPATAAWASQIADALRPIARSPLPEIPSGATGAAAPTPAAEEPVVRSRPRPTPAPAAEEPVVRSRPRSAEHTEEEPVVRARPRPRATPADEPARATTGLLADPTDAQPDPVADLASRKDSDGDATRNNLFGGALLIGGLGILVAALIIWLVTKDGDDESGSASTGNVPTATATASATGSGSGDESQFTEIGELALTAEDGGDGQVGVLLYASPDQKQFAFQLVGQDVPANGKGEAYGVWLLGNEDHFLGYAPPVAKDGQLGTSGPREADQANFADWLTTSKRFVVTRETDEGAEQPGEILFAGNVADFAPPATATATP